MPGIPYRVEMPFFQPKFKSKVKRFFSVSTSWCQKYVVIKRHGIAFLVVFAHDCLHDCRFGFMDRDHTVKCSLQKVYTFAPTAAFDFSFRCDNENAKTFADCCAARAHRLTHFEWFFCVERGTAYACTGYEIDSNPNTHTQTSSMAGDVCELVQLRPT